MNWLKTTAALTLIPLALTPAALAQVAGSSKGLQAQQEGQSATATRQVLDRVDALVKAGQLIRAREALNGYFRSPASDVASAQDAMAATESYATVERKIRSADPCDISLEKGTLALEAGDLVTAEKFARQVEQSKDSQRSHRVAAAKLIADSAQRRAEFAPIADRAIDQAMDDYVAGRFEAAKTAAASVAFAGVPLTDAQRNKLDQLQLQLLKVEREQGRAIEVAPVNLGVWQPGVVRREGAGGGETPAPPAAPPPAAAPASEPAPAGETPVMVSETTIQPENPPAPAPSQPTGQDELIQAALKAQAGAFIAEADKLASEERWNLALDKYRQAAGPYRQYLTPDQAAYVDQKVIEMQTRLNVQPLSERTIGEANLIRQRTLAEFENNMQQAQASLEAGDTRRATDLMAQSRLTVAQTRAYFNPQELADLNTKIDDMNRTIEQRRNEIDAAEREQQAKDRAADAAAAEQRRAMEKDRKINESIDRARALQMEQKYAEALQVVDQILFLDPRNPSGLLLRDTMEANLIFQRFHDIQRRKGHLNANLRLDIAEDMLPPKGIMDYPTEWPKKSFERGELSAFYDTRENRTVLAKVETTPLPVAFDDSRLADVLAFVASVTGENLDADWASLREIGVNEDTPISLKISRASARVVLDRVVQKASPDEYSKVGWSVEDGIIRVASQTALNQNTTLAIYDISDLLFEPGTYDEVPQIDLQSLLQQSQGGGGGGGQSPFRDDQQDRQQDRMQEMQRRQDRITLIREIITSNVDPEGWKDLGGDVGTIQEINSSLIIRNTPRNHREIVGLLSKLREVRSMQINVETKFLLVNQSWFEQIGFDVDLIINANNNQVRAARANDNSFQPSDLFNFSGSGPGGRRGLQRAGGGAIDLNGDGDNTDPGETANAQNFVNPRGWSPTGFISDTLGLASTLIEGDFATQVAGANPALGISGQFLDDVQVDFLITATQADKRTVQLTAPRLTFTNGQIANIFIVTQQAFVSDLTPVVGDSAVGFDPTVAVASEGVTMLMEGVISSDRRYVTLNVDAGVGRIDGFAQQPVTAVAGGQLVNSADTQSFIQLPTITVTRVRTSVTVPDEGTVLLGGQRLITELEIETGVPVLSKIPILNRFFTNRVSAKEEQTLLILVKPTVLITAEQEEKQFPGILDQLSTGIR
ncbi:MAG: type II secretion system protein GspD [Phycisphaerales bacterium]